MPTKTSIIKLIRTQLKIYHMDTLLSCILYNIIIDLYIHPPQTYQSDTPMSTAS